MNPKAPGAATVWALLVVPLSIAARGQLPPAGQLTAAEPPAATDFRLAPQRGQDETQEWFDRYDCDQQARRQSGYDPANERHGPSQQMAGAEYLRAMTACLTARGYGVRYAPPASPPPPSAALYELPPAQPPARALPFRALSVQAGGGYSLATGSTADSVHGGAAAVAALDWFPSPAWPIGLRISGNYTWLTPAAGLLGLNHVGYNKGQQDLYGGDIDLRVDLSPLPSQQRLYLLAGVGWYRMDTSLEELSGARTCGTRFCGVFPTILAQEHDSSPWEPSWNIGLGWEIALGSHTAFFAEACYQHFREYHGESQLVPISLGLRF